MFRLADVRPAHFLPSLLLLAGGVAASLLGSLTEFFASLFNVLPTLLLLLAGTYCLAYERQRQTFLLVVVYLAYYFLDNQVDFFRANGRVQADTALTFHLCSILLPLLYGGYALWQERASLSQELLARSALLIAVAAVALALARRYPDELLVWLAQVRWPFLQDVGLGLIQLAYPVFALALIGLLVQYLRQPRPLHAAQLLGATALLWMLPKVFLLPHVLHAMTSMVMLSLAVAVAHEAYEMAFRDELTGLPGRRALNERLQRLPRQYVLAMTDVDHFKKFNDTHGHDVGDEVLKLVASRLRKVTGGGKAYRYGGEEFTVVFPGKTVEECLPHLEALRLAVEHYPLQLRDKHSRPGDAREGKQRRAGGKTGSVSVTMSIGVAERQLEQRQPEEVIKCADLALYAAKQAGRNRVMAHGQNRRGAQRLETAGA